MIETQSLSYNPSQDLLPEDEVWARLIPLSTNVDGAAIELKKDETVFGRNEDSDVMYEEVQISGKHMTIKREYEDDEVTPQTTCLVLDTSSNGTYINGVKIGKNNHGVLADGDKLALIQPHKQRRGVQYVFMLNKLEPHSNGEKRIENDYIIRSLLGSGSFAQVFDGLSREADPKTKQMKTVAIKVIDKKRWKQKAKNQNEDHLFREVRIMATLQHDHIIKVFDVYDRTDKLSIVMEKAGGGTLDERMTEVAIGNEDRRGYLEESICRDVMWQMIDALHYMHSKKIAHRDLKHENILLRDKGWHILISDFGLSKEEDLAQSVYLQTMCGTPLFLAPEILNDKWRTGAGTVVTKDKTKRSYSFEVDYWSLGIILYKMLVGKNPYPDDKNVGLLNMVKKASIIYPKKYWRELPDAMDLVQGLLQPRPENRFSYDDIAYHIWMNKGPKHKLNNTGPVPMSLGTQMTSVPSSGVSAELTEVSGVLNHSLKKMDISQNKPVPMSLDTQYKGQIHSNADDQSEAMSESSSEMKVSSSTTSESSSASSESSSPDKSRRVRKVIRGKPSSERRKRAAAKAVALSAIKEGSVDTESKAGDPSALSNMSGRSRKPSINRKRSRVDRDDVKDEADDIDSIPGSDGPPNKTKRLNKQGRNMSVDSINVVPFDSGALTGD